MKKLSKKHFTFFAVISCIIVITSMQSSKNIFRPISHLLFPIELGRFPYNETLEWNDRGVLLFAHNPTNKKETMVTFVNEEKISSFTESLNHLTETYYVLQDVKSKYLYFFETLEVQNGVIAYHQLSLVGDITGQKITFALMMKNLGNYPVEKLKTKDIIVCSQGIVLLFECEKEKDILTDIAVFITDNNCLSYAVILGVRDKKSKFNTEAYSYHYAGNTDTFVSFSRKSHDPKKKGWELTNISYKAKIVATKHIASTVKFGLHQQSFIGQTGAYYLKKVHTEFEGQVFTYNDIPYILGYETIAGKIQLSCYTANDKGEYVLCSSYGFGAKLEGLHQLGVEETNQGFALRIGSSKIDICTLAPLGKIETKNAPFAKTSIENPLTLHMLGKPVADKMYFGFSKDPKNIFSFSKKLLNTKQGINFEAL
jgi:hypothetical protein